MEKRSNLYKHKVDEPVVKDSRIDYGVLLPVFLLCLVGLLSVYVALNYDTREPDIMSNMIRQGVWYLIGGVVIVIIMQIKSKWLWKLTPFLYGFGLLIMGLLLKFYDRSETGINRSNNVCYLYAYSLFFIDANRNGFSAYIAHCSYTYLFIDETLGTLSCEQIPSANNLSLIDHIRKN